MSTTEPTETTEPVRPPRRKRSLAAIELERSANDRKLREQQKREAAAQPPETFVEAVVTRNYGDTPIGAIIRVPEREIVAAGGALEEVNARARRIAEQKARRADTERAEQERQSVVRRASDLLVQGFRKGAEIARERMRALEIERRVEEARAVAAALKADEKARK